MIEIILEMTRALLKWQTWVVAALVGPVFWLVVIAVMRWLLFELKAIRKWYFGLPIYQYPAMLLIILGTRHIQKPYGEWKRFDGRWWYTINSQGFNIEENEDAR